MLTEDIELVFSFTWVSNSHIEAISLAQQTAAYFKTAEARQKLHDNGLAWVRNDGFGNRDTFITIDTERRHGFDTRLERVSLMEKQMQRFSTLYELKIQEGNSYAT
ncbi:hypothetical protein QO179_20165 [Bacillus stercoris]|nr:hypothetical protein [Bacillus stercoris]